MNRLLMLTVALLSLQIVFAAGCGQDAPLGEDESDPPGLVDTNSDDRDDTETNSAEEGGSEECVDDPGSRNCECKANDACDEGYICDEEETICREPLICDDVECTNLCQPSDVGLDAVCVNSCEPGYEGVLVDNLCVPVEGANCLEAADLNILMGCEDRNRTCVEEEDHAHCGDCYYGQILDNGEFFCREVVNCGALDCGSSGQSCLPESSTHDAWCGGCLPGYAESAGSCTIDTNASCDLGADGSILDACETLHKVCVLTASSSYECGGCRDGYTMDPVTGLCMVGEGCDALGCANSNRGCMTDPFVKCGECLEGFTKDKVTGECRALYTCADLTCPAETICEEARNGMDAYCRSDQCGDSAIWVRELGVCKNCPSCDGTGEDGIYYQDYTNEFKCICLTERGFYYDIVVKETTPCDKDGDGWTREDAKNTKQYFEENNDLAVEFVWNCYADGQEISKRVKTINKIVLEPELGNVWEKSLAPNYFELYEPTVLDDDVELAKYTEQYPKYGDAYGRYLKAAELNPLTKACISDKADFNANGVEDYLEAQPHSLPLDPTVEDLWSSFAYFLELHVSWYEPPAIGEGYGGYHIMEKTRLAALSDKLPVVYDDQNGEYWQECERMTDSLYSELKQAGKPALGMDFAWTGADMLHHSQFKCLFFDDVAPANSLDAPTTVAYGELSTALHKYVVNDCWSESGTTLPVGAETNPSDPHLSCMLTESSLLGLSQNVRWASVDYIDYDDPYTEGNTELYLRGCINECQEHPEWCPGYMGPEVPRGQCDGTLSDFGYLSCGCGPRYGAADYDGIPEIDGACGSFACEHSSLFGNNFTPATRNGFWMCGEVTGSEGAALTGGGFKVTGNVPSFATTRNSLDEGTFVLK